MVIYLLLIFISSQQVNFFFYLTPVVFNLLTENAVIIGQFTFIAKYDQNDFMNGNKRMIAESSNLNLVCTKTLVITVNPFVRCITCTNVML